MEGVGGVETAVRDAGRGYRKVAEAGKRFDLCLLALPMDEGDCEPSNAGSPRAGNAPAHSQ